MKKVIFSQKEGQDIHNYNFKNWKSSFVTGRFLKYSKMESYLKKRTLETFAIMPKMGFLPSKNHGGSPPARPGAYPPPNWALENG